MSLTSHPWFVLICLISVILYDYRANCQFLGKCGRRRTKSPLASPGVDQKSVCENVCDIRSNRNLCENEFWQSSKVWFPALKAFSWFWLLDPSKSRGIKNFVGNHHMTSSRFESKTWIGKTWTILRKNEKIIFGKIAKPRFYLLTVKFRFSKMSHFNSHIIMKSWDSRISLSWLRLHLKQFSALGGTKQQSTNKCLIMFTEHVRLAKTNHQSEER